MELSTAARCVLMAADAVVGTDTRMGAGGGEYAPAGADLRLPSSYRKAAAAAARSDVGTWAGWVRTRTQRANGCWGAWMRGDREASRRGKHTP